MTFSTLLLALTVVLLSAAALALLVSQYHSNRLLFRCLLVAICVHAAGFGYFGWLSTIKKQEPEEVRLKIAAVKHIEPPKPKLAPKKEKPKPRIIPIPLPKPKPVAPPRGRPEPTKAKKMPKGHTLDKKKSGKPAPKSKVPAHAPAGKKPDKKLTGHGAGPAIATGDGPAGPDDIDPFGKGDTPNKSDVKSDRAGGSFKDSTGEGGEDAGTPDGEGHGDIPKGFKDGKIDGRAYYIRLKYGEGSAWNRANDGTERLLEFLSRSGFKCESESRAMTATELQDKYMRFNAQPTFLYIYCDDGFTLKGSEVNILKKYMENGGFLFLDSRPDPDIKAVVGRTLDRIMGGASLSSIPNSDPINKALFTMAKPGFGDNVVEQKNYGVRRDGRLVVFYSPGNLSAFYARATADQMKLDYFKGTFQMGANVMVYAMFKGDVSSIGKRKGADTTISAKVLQDIGLLDVPKPKALKPGESVKIKAKPGEEKLPEDVKVLD